MDPEILKYPIGKFASKDEYSSIDRENFISTISLFPKRIQEETDNLTEEQLELTYRPGGWNIRQVVHHCADSHMNALLRFKWTLTETYPTIKPYNEAAFAELKDYQLPIKTSLQIIEAVHQHWTKLLTNMKAEDFEKSYFHPEHQKSFTLSIALATYDWHCKHHLAHIYQALKSPFSNKV